MLKEEFSKIADVAEAIVVKNKHSGETKGYGFVKFTSMHDCYRAVDWATPPSFKDSISGKSQVVRITRADSKNNIYVGRLPKDSNERDVKEELESITGCTIKSFEFDGSQRTQGWAYFKDHDTTIKAIKSIQQKSKYTAALTRKGVDHNQKQSPSTKVLFAKGVKSQDEGDALLKALGTELIEKVIVPLDMAKKTPLGHAFIYCHSVDDAKEVMDRYEHTGVEVQGRTVIIAWGQPKHRGRFSDHPSGGPYLPYDYSYMLYPPEYYPPPPHLAYPPPPSHHEQGARPPRSAPRSYDSAYPPKTARQPVEYYPPPYSMPPHGMKVYEPVGYPPYGYPPPPME
eukprot:gene14591-17252_t